MKKIIIALFCGLFSFTVAHAELGINIGVSGQVGQVTANGSETENSEKTTADEVEAVFGTASFFVEKTLDFLPGPLARLSLGYDYVPHDIGTGTAGNTRKNSQGAAADPIRDEENTVKADFENLNTFYLTANLTDWLYVKAGLVEVDVVTKETLETGSAYGNASLDGEMYGIGVATKTDNGFFARLEANWMDIDGVTLTSTTNSDNKVTLDGIDTVSARISVGKSF
jgi:hypothetical protein